MGCSARPARLPFLFLPFLAFFWVCLGVDRPTVGSDYHSHSHSRGRSCVGLVVACSWYLSDVLPCAAPALRCPPTQEQLHVRFVPAKVQPLLATLAALDAQRVVGWLAQAGEVQAGQQVPSQVGRQAGRYLGGPRTGTGHEWGRQQGLAEYTMPWGVMRGHHAKCGGPPCQRRLDGPAHALCYARPVPSASRRPLPFRLPRILYTAAVSQA